MMGLLDLIFPKTCVACGKFGSYLCESDRTKIQPAKSFCPVCLKAAIGGTTHSKCKGSWSLDGLICIYEYKSPMKEIVTALKYRFVTDLRQVLKAELRKIKTLGKYDFSGYTLVPIPLSASRKRWRGFNQAEVLGDLFSKSIKAVYEPEFLKKTRETQPQVWLKRKERLKQMKWSFQSLPKETVSGRNFIVFDDVWTTGATLKAAGAAIKRKGANKVWGITLASSH